MLTIRLQEPLMGYKMSSFQDLGVFVHNNSETEAQMRFAALNDKTERELTRNTFGLEFYLLLLINVWLYWTKCNVYLETFLSSGTSHRCFLNSKNW